MMITEAKSCYTSSVTTMNVIQHLVIILQLVLWSQSDLKFCTCGLAHRAP